MPRKRLDRPVQSVQRYAYTREEAATSLGMSVNHFAEKVQPLLKLVICGQLILIPPAELERWVRENSKHLTREAA